MATELIRTRCTAGWLIVADTVILIERAGIGGLGGQQTVIPRAMLVAASMRITSPSIFGKGGASTLTLVAQGMAAVTLAMVRTSDAQRIMAILGFA